MSQPQRPSHFSNALLSPTCQGKQNPRPAVTLNKNPRKQWQGLTVRPTPNVRLPRPVDANTGRLFSAPAVMRGSSLHWHLPIKAESVRDDQQLECPDR